MALPVKDYTRNRATAQRLIAKNGRAITLVKFSVDNEDNDDPTGPRDDTNDVIVEDVPGVFVYPGGETALGFKTTNTGMFAECEKIALVAADGINAFEKFDRIIDGAIVWKITSVETLEPGNMAILYYLGVNQ